MKKSKLSLIIITLSVVMFLLPTVSVAQDEKYNFPLVSHIGRENPFGSQLYEGYRDALEQFDVNGNVYTPPGGEGDFSWQLRTFKTILSKNPDGIITTIPHADMFDSVIKRAVDQGIPVIATNIDDPEGPKDNARLSYIGQKFEPAGYKLAREAIQNYFPGGAPSPENLHVLISLGVPGQVALEHRKIGIQNYLEEYGVPDKNIEVLETTMDVSKMQSRVLGYLKANPETNLILGTQFSAGGYLAAKSLDKDKDEITIAGFDQIPTVLDGIEEGYISFTIDQQPYLQGYLPVVQLFLRNKAGSGKAGAWDVNTGMKLVDKDNYEKYR